MKEITFRDEQIKIVRQAKYKLFSLLFLYPSEERVEKVKSISRALKEITNEEFFSFVEYLEFNDEVRAEYVRLFNAGFNLIHPYEGAYYHPQIVGMLHFQLQQEYIKYGFIADKFLPDHISVELEFMSYLVGVEDFFAQKSFLERLMKWVPIFSNLLPQSVYKRFSEELLIFLESEKNFLISKNL